MSSGYPDIDPASPDAPIWHEDDGELREQDHQRAAVSLEEMIADAGEEAFAEADTIEFDPERPDDDPVLAGPGEHGPRTVGNPAAVASMRGIMRIGRLLGVTYRESAGWTTRGRSATFTPEWSHQHHTAAARDIDALLISGRPDVSGPLANWAGHNDGVMVALAAGRANHAGVGTIPSSKSYGLEQTGPVPAGSYGTNAFPSYRSSVLHQAATCIYHGWPVSRVVGHKETARPIGRKPDPHYDMGPFRTAIGREVTRYKSGSNEPVPPPEEAFFLANLDAADRDMLAAAFKAALTDNAVETNLAQAIDRGVGAALILEGTTSARDSVQRWYALGNRIATALETLAKAAPGAP